MANLSQDDRTVISKHPLDDSLDHLEDSLRKAEQSYRLSSISYDGARDTRDQRPLKAVSRLLHTLMGHDVALTLRSKTGNENLASELSTLFRRVQNNDFNYQLYRPLLLLVIDNISDFAIWNAVFDLINPISQTTPPTSIPPSFDGTPVIFSSASMQGGEQTNRLLEISLFDEIKNCTYREVEGFFTKYFEGKEWSKQSREIYEAVKDRHVDGRWTSFPDPPDENAVWDWLSRIQDEYLTDARGIYYTTATTTELVGAETRRQLDFFIKRKTDTVDTSHDWKDVRVIGEHRVSQKKWKNKFLQICRYVRDVFSVQPTRRFVHAFTLIGTTMELWVFDRSGPYSSGPFDIHDKPERFIRALMGYTLMSDDELGLDSFIKQDGQDNVITIQEDTTGKDTKIQLEHQPMVIHRAIVCRGTTCYRSKDRKKVVKLSWPSDLRPLEAEHLHRARDRGVTGVATLFGHHDITSIEKMRDSLTFPPPHRFRNTPLSASTSFSESQSQVTLSRSFGTFQSLGISHTSLGKRKSIDRGLQPAKKSRSNSQTSKLREEYEAKQDPSDEKTNAQAEVYKNRIFSCLVVSPAGRTIKEFRSVSELLTALRDAIKGHQSLLSKAQILHRDISENNIIITDPETAAGFSGMLIDLDLAVVDGERTGGRHMTGTMEFMAIDVLRGVEHTYRHDLESFFYVLLWICARRAWEREFYCKRKDRPADSVLGGWYGDTTKNVASDKQGSMHADGFEEILDEFVPAFDCIKPLCRKLRSIIFPLLKDGKLDLRTPADPSTLYKPIIKAFEDAIAGLNTGT
jgi:Fungal protein kinase